MSNIVGDILWNYITKPYQMLLLDKAYQYYKEEAIRGEPVDYMTADMVLKDYGVTDPQLRADFTTRWQTLPKPSKKPVDSMNILLNTLAGQAAKSQLEAVSGVKIDDTTPVSQRLFEQLGIMAEIGAAAAAAEIAGAAIPTTNLQYAGVAIKDYLEVCGLNQITGFGYGMLFSNVVSPMVAQELNRKVHPTLIDPVTSIVGYRRGALSLAQMTDILARQGYSDIYQKALLETTLFYPSPQDFILFATRDTFKPDVVAKYGYDQDYPSDIDAQAEKAGISSEWMRHYWRAHWQLPSPQMGYEMMHRRIITREEMATLLKIGDMAPWWAEKVIDISYSPYTRVDVRRLYKDGIIDETGVYENYLDIGYDEEHARNLTDWTIKDASRVTTGKAKDLTESKILKAYEYGELTVEQTTEFLVKLGYDQEESAVIIALIDHQATFNERDQEWKLLKARYVAGLDDEGKAKTVMDKLKLPQKQQEKWLRQLKREKELDEIAVYKKQQTASAKKTSTET